MECRREEKPYTISSIFDIFDVDENKDIKDIIDFNFHLYEGNEKNYFYDSLKSIYKIGIEQKEEQLKEMYKTEQDLTKRREIVMELGKITKMKNRKLEND